MKLKNYFIITLLFFANALPAITTVTNKTKKMVAIQFLADDCQSLIPPVNVCATFYVESGGSTAYDWRQQKTGRAVRVVDFDGKEHRFSDIKTGDESLIFLDEQILLQKK